MGLTGAFLTFEAPFLPYFVLFLKGEGRGPPAGLFQKLLTVHGRWCWWFGAVYSYGVAFGHVHVHVHLSVFLAFQANEHFLCGTFANAKAAVTLSRLPSGRSFCDESAGPGSLIYVLGAPPTRSSISLSDPDNSVSQRQRYVVGLVLYFL